MSKEICLEYTLKTRSKSAVWTLVSTVVGLKKWLADDVYLQDDSFVFVWGDPLREHDERKASVEWTKEGETIRLHWEDSSEEYYWEMRLLKNEIAENCHLEVREVVDDDEEDDVKILWENSIRKLHQITGL